MCIRDRVEPIAVKKAVTAVKKPIQKVAAKTTAVAKNATAQVAKTTSTAKKAVSYTHLDVYRDRSWSSPRRATCNRSTRSWTTTP